jgi:hypothetical protein
LVKKLADMGIQPQQQQLQQQRMPTAAPAEGSRCPYPVAAGTVGTVTGGDTATSSSSSSSSSSECPFHNGSPGSSEIDTILASSTDILSLAVRLSQQQDTLRTSSNSSSTSGLDLEMLLSQMKTFFAAGHDTTASLIGWTLWFMSQHPEIEQKLLDEVMTVMGAASSPTYEQLAEMRYLNAVLKVGGTL